MAPHGRGMGGPAFAPPGRPGFFDDLWRALDGQGTRRDVFRDHGAGSNVRAFANRQGSDETRVRPYEGVVTDRRVVLVDAVVVARDRPRTDVDAISHRGIADVREVVGLGAASDARLLDLDEVADPRLDADVRLRPQVAERSELRL